MQNFQNLPGPKGLPVLGNFTQLDRHRFHLQLEEWAETFGPFFKFNLIRKRFIAVTDLEAIHEILRKRPVEFRRMTSMETIFRELGVSGVFSEEGDSWRRQRKLTSPAFHSAHLAQFMDTVFSTIERLRKRWELPAAQGRDIDVCKEFTRLTVDVTSALAFDYDMNTLEKGEDVIQKNLEKIFPAVWRRLNAPFPYWRYIRFQEDRDIERALAEVRKTVQQIIANARQAYKDKNSALPRTLLDALLAAQENETTPFTDEELFGNVMTFLVAGEDTSATALGWVIQDLLKNPDVQRKMQEEADQVLGEKLFPRSLSDLEHLKYIEAVLLESMRLHPVGPVMLLEANRDIEVRGVSIPAKTNVILLLAHNAKDEKHFSQPKLFYPDRWLDTRRPPDWNHNLKAYLPFGGGTRICPGRSLAMQEMKAALAMLARNYSISPPANGAQSHEQLIFAATPVNLWAKLQTRPQPRPRLSTASMELNF